MLSVAKIHSQCKPPCARKRGGKGRYLFFHPLHLAEKPKGSSISQFPLPHPSLAERTESALSNSEVYAGCSNCTCLAITSWCAAMHKSWDGVEQILLRYTHHPWRTQRWVTVKQFNAKPETLPSCLLLWQRRREYTRCFYYHISFNKCITASDSSVSIKNNTFDQMTLKK